MDTLPCPLLDETKVAKRLGCRIKTLQAWRSRGGGPEFVRIGRLIRYEAEAIQRWIESRRASSTSTPWPPAA